MGMPGSGFKKRHHRYARVSAQLAWWRSASGVAKVIGAVAAAATALSTATISVVSALHARADDEGVHPAAAVAIPLCKGVTDSAEATFERGQLCRGSCRLMVGSWS
jgi:hypothetical protein